jgi:hypothetical protein
LLLFGFLRTLHAFLPPLQDLEDHWASLVSWAAHEVGLVHLNVGPTAAGIPLIELLVCVGVFAGVAQRPGRWLLFLLSLVLLQVAFVLAGGRLMWVANVFLGHGGHGGYVLLDLGWMLALLLALPAVSLLANHHADVAGVSTQASDLDARHLPRKATRWPRAVSWVAAGGALLLWVSFALNEEALEDRSPRRVVLQGFGPDYVAPSFERFGSKAPSMFGYLPTFLESAGFEVRQQNLAKNPDFEDADVLVLINLQASMGPEMVQRIQEYVRGGGGLLLLGDHTGMDAIRKPFNEIAADLGIEFNFDSALAFRDSWTDGMSWIPHPITQRVADEVDLQIWTGASLRVRSPAYAVIRGRAAYSDWGDERDEENGYLGDFHYRTNERLGDLALVAAAEPGQGRALVFGDTSSFQSLALGKSRAFAEDCFRWLASPKEQRRSHQHRVACAGTTLALGGLSVALSAPVVAPALALLLAVPLAGFWSRVQQPRRWTAFEPVLPIAWVDFAHHNRALALSWKPDALGGLQTNLLRNGYQPFLARHLAVEALPEAELLIIHGPMGDYSEKELEALLRWVRQGGLAVLAVGQPEAQQVPGLLQAFGFSVSSIPLGQAQTELLGERAKFQDSYALIPGAGVEVLLRGFDHPLMVWRAHGSGGLLGISDSQFFLNKNLEDDTEYIPENVLFLRELLAHLQARLGHGQSLEKEGESG